MSNHDSLKFRNFCLLVYVLFSLYLLGDAFSRWDGFSYYASFSEFLPSVSLAWILWSGLSLFTAILLWVLFKVFKQLCSLIGIEIEIEHVLIYFFIILLSGGLFWKGKRLIWPNVETSFQIKIVVLLVTLIISTLIAWLFRGRAKQWSGIVIQRLTPLVWLFGMFIILAVPIVAYSTLFKGPHMPVSKDYTHNSSSDRKYPNIILVTFDALTARNMSLYGYERETTPFISKWSKDATVFTMAEAASNFTTPAVASLMTGKRVWTHQTYHIAGMKPVRSDIESLPYLLKENGYFNMAFVVNPFASVDVLGMTNSFDVAPLTSEFGTSASLFGWKFGFVDKVLYRAFGDKIRLHNWIIRNDFILSKVINLFSRNISQTEVPPEKVFNRFLEMTDGNLPEPFFAWIHVFPPHDPYLPPASFKGKFSNDDELRTYKEQEKLIEESYKYLFDYKRIPEQMEPSVNLMRDYYDEFISYIDKEFEEFIDELDKRKIEDAAIVLTADHGDSFTHGYLTHGGPFLYEEVTHVPLVIKEKDQPSGKIISDLVEQIDVTATILDLANIPIPSWMEGRSLVPLIRGHSLPARPAFSMNFEQNRSRGHHISTGSIAVWDYDYKLIHYIQRDESLLFNLKNDHEEKYNIFGKEPGIGERLLNKIKEELQKANDKISSSADKDTGV